MHLATDYLLQSVGRMQVQSVHLSLVGDPARLPPVLDAASDATVARVKMLAGT
jgi:hypothetical protein